MTLQEVWRFSKFNIFYTCSHEIVNPIGRAVEEVGLRPLVWWDFGLDSRRGHRYPTIVSVVSDQAESFELG